MIFDTTETRVLHALHAAIEIATNGMNRNAAFCFLLNHATIENRLLDIQADIEKLCPELEAKGETWTDEEGNYRACAPWTLGTPTEPGEYWVSHNHYVSLWHVYEDEPTNQLWVIEGIGERIDDDIQLELVSCRAYMPVTRPKPLRTKTLAGQEGA